MFVGECGTMMPLMNTPATPGWWLHVGREHSVTYRRVPPIPLTPLIGREVELVELADLLETERVVTLTGSGGCGKTRLAGEVAGRVLRRFPGGVIWVDLASCTEHDDVLATIIDLLDIVESPGEAGMDSIVRLLLGRPPMLLVLDNAEHVLAATSEFVAAVVRRVPQASVLSTSREPIGVAGEMVWRVPSLATPPTDLVELSAAAIGEFDAIRLFADRAGRVRRGFAITDSNAAAIAQICGRLDGLPLAIELAAARVRTMPPERIASQLDDRFRLLAGGPRTLLARQQTLQASVAWSEGLLDQAERAAFRRLGVFVAGFTTRAAEAVIGSFEDVDAYDIADIVGRLVDKSLVQLDDNSDRYSMLETIRSYAMQRLLETDELARARDAHATWFARWLGDLVTSDRASDVNEWWTGRLRELGIVDPEWPNCASAIDWVPAGSPLSLRLVAGLGDYWAMRQRVNDSARYGMPALVAGDRESEEWLYAMLRMHAVRTNAGDQQFAVLRQDATARATAAGDRRSALRLEIARLLMLVMFQGPRPEVLREIEAVSAEAAELGEWSTVWNACQGSGLMLVSAGRLDEAMAFLEPLTSARAMLIRSLAAQSRGELQAAIALVNETQTMLETRLGAVLDRVLLTFAVAGAALALGSPSLLEELRPSDFGLDALPAGFRSADSMARGVAHLLAGDLDDACDVFAEARTRPLHLVACPGGAAGPERDEAGRPAAAARRSAPPLEVYRRRDIRAILGIDCPARPRRVRRRARPGGRAGSRAPSTGNRRRRGAAPARRRHPRGHRHPAARRGAPSRGGAPTQRLRHRPRRDDGALPLPPSGTGTRRGTPHPARRRRLAGRRGAVAGRCGGAGPTDARRAAAPCAGLGQPDTDRVAGDRAGGRGPQQPADRRTVADVAGDGEDPPRPRVSQARDQQSSRVGGGSDSAVPPMTETGVHTTQTFLFTDIEGSTRQWEESLAMSSLVDRHFALLRECVEADSGEVFATMGDGIAAAFGSADAAVRAAISAQQRMPSIGLSVRMGIHTGEVTRVDGDFRGRPVNRAARIMAAGHGGQILLSDVAASLVRSGPCPVELVDLGTHHLRDLVEPERLWQVVHPDLGGSFPTVRGLTSYSNNLPVQRSSLVGREHDVERVIELVRRHRIVTLTGVGRGRQERAWRSRPRPTSSPRIARRVVRGAGQLWPTRTTCRRDRAGARHQVRHGTRWPTACARWPANGRCS